MHSFVVYRGKPRHRRLPMREGLALGLVAAGAACVPGFAVRSLSPVADAAVITPGPPLARQLATDSPPAPAPAQPLPFAPRSQLDALRALDCLTQAIYYEAASEPEQGQRAVAQVVLNRVRHPLYPATVCGVVYQGPVHTGGGCQFTFTCDGSLLRRPSEPGWEHARRIAATALAGAVYAPVGSATHYHANYVLPVWAASLGKVAAIGTHIFYRMPGARGEPAAFRQVYAGGEPLPVPAYTYRPPEPARPLPLPAVAAQAPDDRPLEASYAGTALPQSQVQPYFRNSGMPRAEFR